MTEVTGPRLLQVDAAMETLAARRFEVQREAILLRLYLLVVHQELVFIKACEEREEDFLAAKEVDCHEVQNEVKVRVGGWV